MMKTRLFISHSSPTQEDKNRLREICSILEQGDNGYDVLVDIDDIQVGDQWRTTIHVMLAECQAAAILFSPTALVSSWVLKEATILSWRKSLDRTFPLVPVRFPGVEAEAFERDDYSPLLLKELQHLKANDPQVIAFSIRESVGTPPKEPTPLDRLALIISTKLGQIGDRMLERVCDEVFGGTTWTPELMRSEAFADRLAREMLRHGPNGLVRAVEILDRFQDALDRRDAKDILEILAPFWVEGDAAGRIPDVAERIGMRRDVALNGRLPAFTAQMYLRRAYPSTDRWKVISVDGAISGLAVEDIKDRMYDQIRKWESLPTLEDLDIESYLKVGIDFPLFVILPAVPDADVLRQLRQDYVRITFILPTGERLPNEGLLPDGTLPLNPELPIDVEQQAFFRYLNAMSFAS